MKSILIQAETLPEAWEKAVVACWEQGDSFKTEYDHAGDPPSKDCTMMVHITDPMKEPRISKILPLGLNDLEKYRSEMIFGCHDYYMSDLSNENRWKYTYNSRLREYKSGCSCYGKNDSCPICGGSGFVVNDQIQNNIDMLRHCGYTRRARSITWQPSIDPYLEDCPCLQSIALRIEEDFVSGEKKLNMNINFRSNDLYKAFYSNAYVFTELQNEIAKQLGISVGSYVHVSESMHIYGSYFKEVDNFINHVGKTKQEERSWNTLDCTSFMIDGCNELLLEVNMPEDKKAQIRERKAYLENLL